MTDRVGQQLGNYHLIRLLGRGGFAEVYLGKHLRLKTQAAIKVLRTQLADDDVEGFLNEARTIAHLEHSHIVRVLDFDVEEGIPFLVMGYAANGNLRQRYAKGTILSLDTIVTYVKQVTDALQYAHDEKLIHRDIKPENMLLGRHDDLLLSDFGIALVTQSSRLQSMQEAIGTAAYMAPEQLQGKPRRASDQYALGIVVYEWLCVERPFNGNFTELYSQHLFVPPPSLCKKIPSIPPEIEQVVLKALAKDLRERFASVRAFATALENACQHSRPERPRLVTSPPEMTSTRRSSPPTNTIVSSLPNQLPQPTNMITPPSPSTQTIKAQPFHASAVSPLFTGDTVSSHGLQPSKRRISRRAVLIGMVGLAGLSIVGGVTWWESSPHPIYVYHNHYSDEWFAVAWSPNGKRVASASEDVQVWDALDGGNVYTYRGHSWHVSAIAWSPNGKRIASAGFNDHTVQVWDALDGGNVYTYRGHSRPVRAVAWSPDGKRIASGSTNNSSPLTSDHTVQVWDATDGGNVYTYYGQLGVETVAWSPNGRRIATGSWNDHTVQVWDAADGGNVYTYHGHNDVVHSVAWSPDGRLIASGSRDQTVQVWQVS